MIRKRLLLLASIFAIALPVTAVTGEITLKEIMQELRRNFLEVSDGFLLDDFDRVAEGAIAIAEHPRISPEQIKRVAEELGPEMPVFKNFDVQVHELSLEMYKAAIDRDRAAAIAAYHGMVAACFDCHAAYRERIAEALMQER